ncbi:MAG: hypothetical protein ABWY51_07660 [Gaiellaceae bacterium]
MKVVGKLGLLIIGLFGGFMAAAAVVKRAIPSRGDAESDEVTLMAVFDGVELRSEAKAFRGGSMFAWYGGIEADLREAQLAPDARLSVTALFGGIALRVPPEWRIEKDIVAVAGGYDVSGAEPEDPEAPVLRLEGRALCGGIAVSRKPPADGD